MCASYDETRYVLPSRMVAVPVEPVSESVPVVDTSVVAVVEAVPYVEVLLVNTPACQTHATRRITTMTTAHVTNVLFLFIQLDNW